MLLHHAQTMMSRSSGRKILRTAGAALLLLLLPNQGATASEPSLYPPETVLLFVAAWCAPCHGELAHLADLSRAARPYRVLVVPFDDGRATRAMLDSVPPAQRWLPDRQTQRRLAQMVAAESPGLPFSVAVDTHGRACATQAEALTGATAEALVARCRS